MSVETAGPGLTLTTALSAGGRSAGGPWSSERFEGRNLTKSFCYVFFYLNVVISLNFGIFSDVC